MSNWYSSLALITLGGLECNQVFIYNINKFFMQFIEIVYREKHFP